MGYVLKLESKTEGTIGNTLGLSVTPTSTFIAPDFFTGGIDYSPLDTTENLKDYLDELHVDFEAIRNGVNILFRAIDAGRMSHEGYMKASTDRIWVSGSQLTRGEDSSEFLYLFEFENTPTQIFAFKNDGTDIFSLASDNTLTIGSKVGVDGTIYLARAGDYWECTVTKGLITNIELVP